MAERKTGIRVARLEMGRVDHDRAAFGLDPGQASMVLSLDQTDNDSATDARKQPGRPGQRAEKS